ncbi:DUF3054 domain-containing protein [Cryobacterium sp. TMT1-21]|uniref:DUF3054 domain-containing protein n=1 Tax=Cryobacterium shii TaxID=1259235 RepID=A0AAQ2C4Q1_9MICO|nr:MULTISPECIES: DUF3054 domain-containing protein [Cryobacterium]TFC43343.1 DUF3054 domain-containing protein [Cryobacterium shii]TFC87333.1 DUF3054 domain-containing protein [Cryobacterium sp. TmT2-59]TFD14668.1 DUF3054 domain-containing protein [Cryobacterium sp. TMT1-21]TFD17829.1 DUF3054 domain-containing protein [Cryobacterium sp. TMT2-23]TFD18313.1 DUF3054 domain-containing protein [Cryobacterium sp. TMT4-10]
MVNQRVRASTVLVSAGLDAALVLVFVLIGRASHSEGLLGALSTWWPFLGGLAIGWVALRAWRSPQRIVWTGVGIWLAAVAGGMLLRLVSGQGVQLSFVIVTTIVLGVFLLGWRGLAALLRRAQARRGARIHPLARAER